MQGRVVGHRTQRGLDPCRVAAQGAFHGVHQIKARNGERTPRWPAAIGVPTFKRDQSEFEQCGGSGKQTRALRGGSAKDGTIVAERVKVLNGSDDSVSGVELHGTISAVDATAKTFVLRGMTIWYGGAVAYSHGSEAELTCSEAGVVGPLVGLVGSLQALEALKLLAQFGEPLVGRLLLIDALGTRIRELRVKRDPACTVCGKRDG